MNTPVDLSQLPAPDLVEPLDYEKIFAARKAALIARFPEAQRDEMAATLALESEPLTILLQENAYRELLLRQRINEAARAVMLTYATGSDLDHLAALFGVQRLVVKPGNANAMPPTADQWESDAALRDRTQGALAGFSTAGPRGAYIWHARAADGRVADASAISPLPATVVVTILANHGDGTAPTDLLARVQQALNDDTVRPLGDRLTVQSAQMVPYTVKARLFLLPGPQVEPILNAARARLKAYTTPQRRLGRDIRRSALFAALHVEGVQRVELIAPDTDLVLNETQAADCTQTHLQIAHNEK